MFRIVSQNPRRLTTVVRLRKNAVPPIISQPLTTSSVIQSKDEFVGVYPSQQNFKPQVDWEEQPLPAYRERLGESLDRRRARLQYQSRKRGITENGLLLSTFAAEYLEKMSEEEMVEYDTLINKPTNDWEIYYWATGANPVPVQYDTKTFQLLKEHAKNINKVNRTTQPDTFYKVH